MRQLRQIARICPDIFGHIELLKMMSVRLRHFSRRCRSDPEHSMTFFHHLNIIKAGTAGSSIADIGKIAQHIMLAV